MTAEDRPIRPPTGSSGGLEGELRFSPPPSPVTSNGSISQRVQARRNNSLSPPPTSRMSGEMDHDEPTFFVPSCASLSSGLPPPYVELGLIEKIFILIRFSVVAHLRYIQTIPLKVVFQSIRGSMIILALYYLCLGETMPSTL